MVDSRQLKYDMNRLWQHGKLISWMDIRCQICGRFISHKHPQCHRKYCEKCYKKLRTCRMYHKGGYTIDDILRCIRTKRNC